MLRFLKLCARMTMGFGMVGLVFLVPIYGTGNGDTKEPVPGIMRYTMSNILPGGSRLWASFVFAYVYTLGFLYMLYKEYEAFTTLRQRFFISGV
jgi:hypothetical protein